jgi:lipoprotein-anchoring transpeptidase ErfK/SrfK
MWIDLSKPTYGLHGTAAPAPLFQQESHGCVRMTNWDAEELAGMVQQGTVVEFIEG